MKFSKIIVGTFCIWMAVSSCGKNKTASNEEAATPQTYPIIVLQEQDAQLESVYPATIRGQEDIEIRPRIDGFIEAIYVDEGLRVKKGQRLFRINSPDADSELLNARAAVVSAEAQVNTAKLNVDRMRPLAEQQIIGEVQLATLENSYQTALAAQAQAQASLYNAEAKVGWKEVTSPVDGLVGTIPYRIGSLVSSSNVLTTVANTSNVFAYFSLNEKELAAFLNDLQGNTQAQKIKNIPPVTLTLTTGTVYPYKGKVETISGLVNVSTGSASFRAEFPNEEGMLRSGTSGRVSIPKELENVFVIPQKATFAQQDKVLSYVVQGDSVVQRIITVVPTPDGKSYAVTSGLNSGEKIVADGVATLSQGKKIQYN